MQVDHKSLNIFQLWLKFEPQHLGCTVMQCKSQISWDCTKATSKRPVYLPLLYQINSTIARLLGSFLCQVRTWGRSSSGDSYVLQQKSLGTLVVLGWLRSRTSIAKFVEFRFQLWVESCRREGRQRWSEIDSTVQGAEFQREGDWSLQNEDVGWGTSRSGWLDSE